MKRLIRLADANRTGSMISSNQGFTLVELIVVTVVFIAVLIITGSSLKTMLDKGNTVFRSEESNTEGVIGLEILRHDLQQIGFGLFTDDTSIPTYPEAAAVPYSTYNDVNSVPRAIVTDDNLSVTGVLAGTDYLALKGTTLARSTVSQLWTYVDDTGQPKRWGRDDFSDNNDKLVMIEQKFDASKNTMVRRLVQKATNNYGVAYSSTGAFQDQDGNDLSSTGEYTPSTGKIYYLYGVDAGGAAFTLRAPFNRADFFINRDSGTPGSCSPAAGVLYKATMIQSSGLFTKIPILDCVADMQVILGWNTSAEPEKSNEVQAYSSADGLTVSGNANGLNLQSIRGDAMELRKRLRLVMVYILAQDGRVDSNFVNTNSSMVIGDPGLSAALAKTVDLTAGNFRNYRWKLYRVIVRPKNLF